jgi:uncharacterized membrane protein YdbT with pleckstrin-like domain
MSEVSIHRWPAQALRGDLVRGVVSFAVVLLLLLVPPLWSLPFFGVLVLVVLFGLYLASTVSRFTSVLEMDDDGIRIRGGLFGPRTIKWAELRRFELRHFPLSRDRKEGWMDLKLRGSNGRTIAVDDRLDRFGEVLARAWTAARAAEIGISDSTHANLAAAGILPKRNF